MPPEIQCPASLTINTDSLNCSAAFSYTVSATDDEPGWILAQTAGLLSGADFPLGETLNSFQVSNNGDTSVCSFTVTVTDRIPGYFIRFPDDHFQVSCDNAGYYGEPVFFGADCEQIHVSFEDQIFTIIVDACFPLERTWTIVNWSTYNPNLPLIQVPNPRPETLFSKPDNLPGPVVSAPGTTGPWASTIKKISPFAPMATDFSAFFNPDANGYLYKQVIWVVDFELPVIADCPAASPYVADSTQNDSLLWNNVFNPALPAQDLTETTPDLHITATDACSGSSINIQYLLFLDLDGDGVQETVVNPGNLPPNTVFYNNAGNPNYSGGTAVAFDQRPVPANQKYTFGTEIVVNGENKTANVRWSTGQWGGPPFVPVQLPAGIHRIRWTVEDACGNVTTCDYNFVVKGGPAAIHCPPNTTVLADSSTCTATFDYTVIASEDLPGFTPVQAAGLPSGAVFPSEVTVNTFYILNAGDTLSCSFTVNVVDAQPPAVNCTALPNITVQCENFDPTLLAYGDQPLFTDNCCLEYTAYQVNYNLFDTVCNRGTITRTFQGFDCFGNSSGCSQQIVVAPAQAYFVHFPDDIFLTACDGTGYYGEPLALGASCEHVEISYQDEIIEVIPDACFRIQRRWTIVDGCRYDPALPLVNVPNPNPNPIVNHASNLPGPVVSAPGAPAPWESTIVKINPTDPVATDYSSFYTPEANGYVYVQHIKIIDAQKPVLEYCPPTTPVFADSSQNDPHFWSTVFNPALPAMNLSETPVDLQLTATDACSGANINFRYLLYLDLDGDGAAETVVNSDNLPPSNTVFYGNVNNPGFTGGTPVPFDLRPVPPGEKYHFALQTTTDGVNKTAAVRWNTPQSPGTFVVPQLPFGGHLIKWDLEDRCGNTVACDYAFSIEGEAIVPIQEPGAASGFALHQNVPNPFRGGTSIAFDLPEPATAVLSVYDTQGRLVFRHAAAYGQGRNNIDLDDNTLEASGMLYYKLETGLHSAWCKMARIR